MEEVLNCIVLYLENNRVLFVSRFDYEIVCPEYQPKLLSNYIETNPVTTEEQNFDIKSQMYKKYNNIIIVYPLKLINKCMK